MDSDPPVDTSPPDEDGDGSDAEDDCDDHDASVYPGAPEVCGDGLVQDCDATVADAAEDCRLSGALDAADRDVAITGTGSGDYLGWQVVGGEDWTGDGAPDLAVAAPYRDGSAGTNSGTVWLLAGPVTADAEASVTGLGLEGASANDRAGRGLGALGDVDGDGYADLGVGAPESRIEAADSPTGAAISAAGRAYLLLGPVAAMDLSDAAVTLVGDTYPGNVGHCLVSVGDLDGDDLPEIAVCEPGGGTVGTETDGQVRLYAAVGAVTGLDDAWFILDATNGNGVTEPRLGATSADGAGDLDGDGAPDLLVGSSGWDVVTTSSFDNSGRVYAISGADLADAAAAGETSAALTTLGSSVDGDASGDQLGAAVAGVGDVNGDGYADAMAGAPAASVRAGEAKLWWGDGSAMWDTSSEVTISGVDSGDLAGRTLDGLGDVDGDGYADLVIGGVGEGVAYLLYGPVTADLALSDADLTLSGFSAADSSSFGDTTGEAWRSVSAGDVNGDGTADLAIGVGTDGSTVGAAFLYFGVGL